MLKGLNFGIKLFFGVLEGVLGVEIVFFKGIFFIV